MTLRELADYLLKEKKLDVGECIKVSLAVSQWAIGSSYIGHFASITEFSRWSGESIRTIDRRRAVIRAVLDEDEFRRLVAELAEGVETGDAALRVARQS
jgi:hypothetical protein